LNWWELYRRLVSLKVVTKSMSLLNVVSRNGVLSLEKKKRKKRNGVLMQFDFLNITV
jgi:hypothetical protein